MAVVRTRCPPVRPRPLGLGGAGHSPGRGVSSQPSLLSGLSLPSSPPDSPWAASLSAVPLLLGPKGRGVCGGLRGMNPAFWERQPLCCLEEPFFTPADGGGGRCEMRVSEQQAREEGEAGRKGAADCIMYRQ